MGQLVVDASAVLSVLLDPGGRGERIAARLATVAVLVAPSLLPYEVANVLRRRRSANRLSVAEARLAFEALPMLGVESWPWEVVADRVWELAGALTAYDAAYVALAEALHVPLLTGDARLARAAPATCLVEVV
jgi:predicted nucleic acid-binding protein